MWQLRLVKCGRDRQAQLKQACEVEQLDIDRDSKNRPADKRSQNR